MDIFNFKFIHFRFFKSYKIFIISIWIKHVNKREKTVYNILNYSIKTVLTQFALNITEENIKEIPVHSKNSIP